MGVGEIVVVWEASLYSKQRFALIHFSSGQCESCSKPEGKNPQSVMCEKELSDRGLEVNVFRGRTTQEASLVNSVWERRNSSMKL